MKIENLSVNTNMAETKHHDLTLWARIYNFGMVYRFYDTHFGRKLLQTFRVIINASDNSEFKKINKGWIGMNMHEFKKVDKSTRPAINRGGKEKKDNKNAIQKHAPVVILSTEDLMHNIAFSLWAAPTDSAHRYLDLWDEQVGCGYSMTDLLVQRTNLMYQDFEPTAEEIVKNLGKIDDAYKIINEIRDEKKIWELLPKVPVQKPLKIVDNEIVAATNSHKYLIRQRTAYRCLANLYIAPEKLAMRLQTVAKILSGSKGAVGNVARDMRSCKLATYEAFADEILTQRFISTCSIADCDVILQSFQSAKDQTR